MQIETASLQLSWAMGESPLKVDPQVDRMETISRFLTGSKSELSEIFI